MPRFKIYGLDNECYADVEIPECSYDINKLEWTEVGRLYKRYANYIARDNGINKTKLIHTNYKHENYKYGNYFYRTKIQQERRKK